MPLLWVVMTLGPRWSGCVVKPRLPEIQAKHHMFWHSPFSRNICAMSPKDPKNIFLVVPIFLLIRWTFQCRFWFCIQKFVKPESQAMSHKTKHLKHLISKNSGVLNRHDYGTWRYHNHVFCPSYTPNTAKQTWKSSNVSQYQKAWTFNLQNKWCPGQT